MRVDLVKGGRRPWPMRLGLGFARWRLGTYPGPPLAISYRPDLWHPALVGYILHGMHGSDGWDKGHAELFSAFVSNLNTCHF